MTRARVRRYLFGAVELQPDARVVNVAGQPRRLEPKAFDLLRVLLDARGRTLGKAELLDLVWGHAAVSESVLARTIMKARKAIEDDPDDPRWIQTVPRVGYRFIGEVTADTAAAALERRADSRHTVGIAPFRNATEQAELNWVSMGLATLVAHSLEGERRLIVVPPGTIASAQGQVPETPGATVRDTAVAALLGLECQVHAVLYGRAGGLRLDYRTQGRLAMRGSVRGDEPVRLAERMVGALKRGLFPADQWPVRFETTQVPARQAFAQALDCEQRKDWPAAAALLRRTLAFEPDSLAAQLQLVRVLANLRDPEAIVLGEQLLKSAHQQSELRLKATAHEALGWALFNIGGDASAYRAAEHLDQASRLAAPYAGEDWVVRIQLGQAIHFHTHGRFERARRCYELAQRGAEAAGNQMRLATILNNRASVELQGGNPISAREFAQDAARICDAHHIPTTHADALATLALADGGLGLMRRANQHCADALALLRVAPAFDPETPAWVAVIAGELALESGQVELLEPMRPLLQSLSGSPQPRVDALVRFALANLDLHGGRVHDALAAMRSAVEVQRSCGLPIYELVLTTNLIWLLLRLGRGLEAAALISDCSGGRVAHDAIDLVAARLYVDADAHHRRGDIRATVATLREVVAATPIGRWNAHARLDLAWLAAERADLDKARHWVRDIGPWLQESPLGLSVRARLEAAQQRFDLALECQQQALDVWNGTDPSLAAATRDAYAKGQAPAPLPRLASLA